jgi:outer membrane protein TolC
MKHVILLAAAVLALTASAASAADPVTLDEYLSLLRQNHPFFTKEELAVDIEQYRARAFLGDQDWTFSAAPVYRYAGEATASDFGAQTRAHSAQVELDLGRSFWSTGGRIGVGVTTGYLDYDPVFGPSEVYRTGFSVSYTQPLLQNIGGSLDRLGYDLSAYSIDLAAVEAAENQEGFLLARALEYLDWVASAESVRIAEERLLLSREQLEQTTRKFQANLVDRVDVLRAEDAVRTAGQFVLQAQSRYRAQQARLAVSSYSEQLYEQSPEYDIYETRALPSRSEAQAALSAGSRLLATFSIIENQLLRNRKGLTELRRPRLDLGVTAGLYGQDSTWGASLGITEPDATVSLVFSQTLGNRTVKADIERTDAEIRQVRLEMASVENSLQADLAALLIQLEELENILELNRAQIQSAEQKTQEEIKLYNQGRSQLIFVIQSRDNEENARLTYAQNAVQYHTLVLQYRALMDELFTQP